MAKRTPNWVMITPRIDTAIKLNKFRQDVGLFRVAVRVSWVTAINDLIVTRAISAIAELLVTMFVTIATLREEWWHSGISQDYGIKFALQYGAAWGMLCLVLLVLVLPLTLFLENILKLFTHFSSFRYIFSRLKIYILKIWSLFLDKIVKVKIKLKFTPLRR